MNPHVHICLKTVDEFNFAIEQQVCVNLPGLCMDRLV